MKIWERLFGGSSLRVPQSQASSFSSAASSNATVASSVKAMDEAATISRDLALASARLQQAAQALGLIAKASEGRSTIANLANIFDKANYPALGEPSPGTDRPIWHRHFEA